MRLLDFNKDVFWLTDAGLVRQENEDNCYAVETPNGFLFVVCDGMGGHVGGAKASAIAVRSIVNFFTKEKYAILNKALADALIFANKQIWETAEEQPELKGMGTTACVLLISDDHVWFAHIGDSRMYLFCNRQQKLYRLTKDHSVVQGLIDQGVISEAEAENHPNKNKLLKSLGVKKDMVPDVCAMPVFPANNDIFLVCSDGLSGMVNDEILQHILKQKTPLQEKGENMLTFAKQAGGEDNITLQLISISNSPYKKTVFERISPTHSSNTSYKNLIKNNITLIAASILLLVTVIFVVIIKSNRGSNDSPQTTVVTEQQSKKAWEKEIENMQVLEKQSNDKAHYYKKTNNGAIITGVIVYQDSYFVGTYVDNGDKTYGPQKGIIYNNNDGSFIKEFNNTNN